MLIACDNITFAKEIAVPHRINLWDSANSAIAHQIALPAGLPYNLDVSQTADTWQRFSTTETPA